jgi:hypothetical protein
VVGWGGVEGCSSSQRSNDNMPSVSLLPRLPPAPDSPDMKFSTEGTLGSIKCRTVPK